MSQPSSSIVSADNADIKYKKALKEISKLISANRVLRESSEKNNIELKEKIDELSLRYEDLEKEYQIVRKEKETFAHYLDEIQYFAFHVGNKGTISNDKMPTSVTAFRSRPPS